MLMKVLSDLNYPNSTSNYGDCFIFWDNHYLIIFDCGSEEHAKEVQNFMNENEISQIDFLILSHDDSDHVNGARYLVDNCNVKKVCTPLILKYIDDIFNKIKEASPTSTIKRDTVKERIIEAYSNIYELGNSLEAGTLVDATNGIKLTESFEILGPSKDHLITSVAKGINGYEGNTMYKETITNAISVQAYAKGLIDSVFLCGDACFEFVEENLDSEYSYIQASHHGKLDFAQKVYELKKNKNSDFCFIISDNTGNTNGGSDDFEKELKQCRRKTTKEGTITIDLDTRKFKSNWGIINDICNL